MNDLKIGDKVYYNFGTEKINTVIQKVRNDGMVKLLYHDGWYKTDFLIKIK